MSPGGVHPTPPCRTATSTMRAWSNAYPSMGGHALLERARCCQPADRADPHVVGPRQFSIGLASNKPLQGLLSLMGRHLTGAAKPYTTLLGTSTTIVGALANQFAFELGKTAEYRHQQ